MGYGQKTGEKPARRRGDEETRKSLFFEEVADVEVADAVPGQVHGVHRDDETRVVVGHAVEFGLVGIPSITIDGKPENKNRRFETMKMPEMMSRTCDRVPFARERGGLVRQ